MPVHLRQQAPGKGHLPSWDQDVGAKIVDAIRSACPGVINNLTPGVIGADISGPVACICRTKPEIAACNAGTRGAGSGRGVSGRKAAGRTCS